MELYSARSRLGIRALEVGGEWRGEGGGGGGEWRGEGEGGGREEGRKMNHFDWIQ